MVGFTEPNQYEPRAKWRETLDKWVKDPPDDMASWQHQISRYWTWRIHQSFSAREAWRELEMEPAAAKAALADSPDSGLVPPELFTFVLARSRAPEIVDGANADPVVLAPTPLTELPATVEDGYSPTRYARPIYQPRIRWKIKLLNPPTNNVGGLLELHLYRTLRTQGKMSVDQAWKKLKMSKNVAGILIHENNVDRGAIPPELIARVVSRATGETVKDEDIFLYPEPRV
jgi:hypothetical protein